MLRMARGLLTQVPGRLVAIGVSFGGPVDAARGLVRLSHHVPGWEEIPLADRLQAELGAPAAVDNDANVAALGEWRFGAGQGTASLLYVTISTGIGGGWVLGGRIWGGADGMAGEIGHMIVRPGGAPCACGRRGCAEAEACGWAIAAKARERLSDERARSLPVDERRRTKEPGCWRWLADVPRRSPRRWSRRQPRPATRWPRRSWTRRPARWVPRWGPRSA